MTRFQRMYLSSGASFAAYLSFYPVCNRTYIDDISVAQRPIRIFHGTADNVAPISRCRTYVRRLREAGHDVVLTEYSGAYHGFDSPVYPPVTGAPVGPPRGCDIYESSPGRLLNRDTGLTPTPKDACLAQTRTVAYDKAAHAKAIEDVREVLVRVLGKGGAR
jgi:dienelactone hydrolase